VPLYRPDGQETTIRVNPCPYPPLSAFIPVGNGTLLLFGAIEEKEKKLA
jgi:hypothetical protein